MPAGCLIGAFYPLTQKLLYCDSDLDKLTTTPLFVWWEAWRISPHQSLSQGHVSHGGVCHGNTLHGHACYRRACHEHMKHGRVPCKRHLMGVHLMGVHLIGVYFTGVCLIDAYFMDVCVPDPRLTNGDVRGRGLSCKMRVFALRVPISRRTHLSIAVVTSGPYCSLRACSHR
jgi:hypothetical protein